MIATLILAISAAIIFGALFFDERGIIKKYLEDSAKESPKEVPAPSVDDQDLRDLTPDLVADVVRFNGYIPDKKEDAVFFMVQGDRYCVSTDMLPCVAIMKRFVISEEGYDIAMMREAARNATESRFMGKCGVSPDGKLLTFFTASLEPKYGHFRDVFNDMVSVVNDMENLFGETYRQMVRDKEDMAKLEANGIPVEVPGNREGKIVS